MDNFFFYFKWGISHILNWEAFDHWLFIVSLIALYRYNQWRRILVLITSFTLGHSISLVLCTWKIVNSTSSFVEFLIPLTIVFTAGQNLYQKKDTSDKMRLKYIAALLFGFIHGMGFANTLQFILNPSENKWIPLLGFNAGIEFSQIWVIAGILYVGEILVKLLGFKDGKWSILLSWIALVGGLILSIQRWPI